MASVRPFPPLLSTRRSLACPKGRAWGWDDPQRAQQLTYDVPSLTLSPAYRRPFSNLACLQPTRVSLQAASQGHSARPRRSLISFLRSLCSSVPRSRYVLRATPAPALAGQVAGQLSAGQLELTYCIFSAFFVAPRRRQDVGLLKGAYRLSTPLSRRATRSGQLTTFLLSPGVPRSRRTR